VLALVAADQPTMPRTTCELARGKEYSHYYDRACTAGLQCPRKTSAGSRGPGGGASLRTR
jgi:hypothetical protein